jgi:hypothetical protein
MREKGAAAGRNPPVAPRPPLGALASRRDRGPRRPPARFISGGPILGPSDLHMEAPAGGTWTQRNWRPRRGRAGGGSVVRTFRRARGVRLVSPVRSPRDGGIRLSAARGGQGCLGLEGRRRPSVSDRILPCRTLPEVVAVGRPDVNRLRATARLNAGRDLSLDRGVAGVDGWVSRLSAWSIRQSA